MARKASQKETTPELPGVTGKGVAPVIIAEIAKAVEDAKKDRDHRRDSD